MRLSLRSITAAAAALLLAAPAAQAQTIFSGNGCGGIEFLLCASWTLAKTSTNSISLTVTNTSNLAPAYNLNSVFTEIGLGNVGGAYTLASGGFSATGYGNWSFTSDLVGYNAGSLQQDNFGADANSGNPQINGLTDGNTATFNFTFAQNVLTSDFANAQVAIHDQGAVVGCGPSTKAVFPGNGTTTSSGCTPTTTTPEPATASLLGAGVLAIGAAAAKRKRSQA